MARSPLAFVLLWLLTLSDRDWHTMPLSKLLSLFRRSRPSSEPAVTSIPTVTFDSSRVTGPVKADILSTLRECEDIPKDKLPAINVAAVMAIEKGGDLHTLHTAIMSNGIAGMTKRRASEIARHVQSRATSLMNVERMAGLGIEEAVWVYSGAPCYLNTKSPLPEQLALDAAHKAADGRRYWVREGLTIDGKRTWPGREVGCKCVSKAVMAGFS